MMTLSDSTRENGMVDYVMSVRAVRSGRFVDKVGPSRFLQVDEGVDPLPQQAITANRWFDQVREAGAWVNAKGQARGDVLFIVHGYNNSEREVMARHRLLQASLRAVGFKGVVVSFDWPCGDDALAYLPDRHRAKLSAHNLVDDGIARLSARQSCNCAVNIHVLGHSTGAYVIREAFDDADDTQLAQASWLVSQIVFAAGDVSAHSMAAGNPESASVYRHCMGLTNYSNRSDAALDLSNVKRLGLSPRVGRTGLPATAPGTAVNVDCTAYYAMFDGNAKVRATDGPAIIHGMPSHSWYFGNAVFTRDLRDTLIGLPTQEIATRALDADGQWQLVRPPPVSP